MKLKLLAIVFPPLEISGVVKVHRVPRYAPSSIGQKSSLETVQTTLFAKELHGLLDQGKHNTLVWNITSHQSRQASNEYEK